jgi:hypothetical protein
VSLAGNKRFALYTGSKLSAAKGAILAKEGRENAEQGPAIL